MSDSLPISGNALPAPLYHDFGNRVYILYGDKVWSALFLQAQYDLGPRYSSMPELGSPMWRGRLDLTDIREDKLPEPPPPPEKPSLMTRFFRWYYRTFYGVRPPSEWDD